MISLERIFVPRPATRLNRGYKMEEGNTHRNEYEEESDVEGSIAEEEAQPSPIYSARGRFQIRSGRKRVNFAENPDLCDKLTRRRLQNRMAQRAFRERKEQYILYLQGRIHELEQWKAKAERLFEENQRLKKMLYGPQAKEWENVENLGLEAREDRDEENVNTPDEVEDEFGEQEDDTETIGRYGFEELRYRTEDRENCDYIGSTMERSSMYLNYGSMEMPSSSGSSNPSAALDLHPMAGKYPSRGHDPESASASHATNFARHENIHSTSRDALGSELSVEFLGEHGNRDDGKYEDQIIEEASFLLEKFL
ncbi:uncharacterized protein VTP21DRAFT_5760 [Calcarisporiella thermophila]|uniref:uncharacterized protein n=1 Tax=Calcarisporiella thermophila TaxID=911321 RepID=UPI0037435D40